MVLSRLPILLVLTALVTTTGCASSDPLAGTWSNATCFGMDATPADIESCAVTLTFTDALDVELQPDWVSLPATANYPGCTTTKLITGQTWSTRHASTLEVLTVSGNGSATVERTGCVNATDDMAATATATISLSPGDSNHQLTDGSLTFLTGDLVGTYQP